MIQKKGTTRHVFILKNIVIKVARIRLRSAIKVFILRNNLELIKKCEFHKFIEASRKHKTWLLGQKERFEEYRIEKEKEVNLRVLPTKKYEIDLRVETCLFAGIMANIHERKFYKETKNLFVMPTYFSFFGLFNVQKRGVEIEFWDSRDVWHYVIVNSQDPNQPWCDNHTLCEIYNFCIDNGKLKLLDYGNRQIAEFLRINGENLYNNFKHPD